MTIRWNIYFKKK